MFGWHLGPGAPLAGLARAYPSTARSAPPALLSLLPPPLLPKGLPLLLGLGRDLCLAAQPLLLGFERRRKASGCTYYLASAAGMSAAQPSQRSKALMPSGLFGSTSPCQVNMVSVFLPATVVCVLQPSQIQPSA